MDNMILTPVQLWEDYDPQAQPLEASFQQFEDKGSYFYLQGYFNGDKYDDGVVRIFFNGRIPKDECKKVAILVDDYDGNRDESAFVGLINQGFGYIFFDYCGEKPGKRHYTKYPKSVDYANLCRAGEHLDHAIPTAKDTCHFVWTKVCRRVVTLATQLLGKSVQIYLIGLRKGSTIAWQTAGMDGRISGLVATLNAGWEEYGDYHKFSDNDIVLSDERARWLAGCAPQTYARFIKCPTLFIGASNSDLTPVDRLENTLNVIAEKNMLKKCICVGHCNSVDITAVKLVMKWLQATSCGDLLPHSPKMSLCVKDGRLMANVEFDTSVAVSERYVYYSYDELDPKLRNWNKISVDEGADSVVIPVYANNERVYAYAQITYAEGYSLSCLLRTYEVGEDELTFTPLKRSQIIYERKKGTSDWIAEQGDSFEVSKSPVMQKGALDIMGITAESGDLTTYTLGEDKYFADDDNLLQFDTFCPQERVLEIELVVEVCSKTARYVAFVKLGDGEAWQKHAIEKQRFKTADMLPLKSWKGVKKLTFKSIGGVLINNILWV
ncbi:MAG: hypothetical protein ACI4MI_01330 [Christensenellales bacterium]